MNASSLSDVISRLHEYTHYQSADYEKLKDLIGEEALKQRLERQVYLYNRHRSAPERALRKISRILYRKLILLGLWSTGQLAKARTQARSPELVHQTWTFENLPPEFDGYRILQLSDFHFDFIPELPGIIKKKLEGLAFDCCALTGDYRGETTGPYDESLNQLKTTRECLGDKVFAVLGNHDNVELMLSFPDMGIKLLMNESVTLEKEGATITLAGIDDPHFYKGHHFGFMDSVSDDVTILLSHSPESWKEAEQAGVDLQLSGHTHGGQLCLPGGIPVIYHLDDCPRSMVKGRWEAGNLKGYTSRGVGSSTLDLRLNCPPEITLHTLRRS